MNTKGKIGKAVWGCLIVWGSFCLLNMVEAFGMDEIRARGVLRHLGVPYANFVMTDTGLDVEIIKGFAGELGLRYEYVKTDWDSVIPDLIGKKIKAEGNDVEFLGDTPVRGDIIATGLTRIPWREKLIDYSIPTFPTQVWVMVRTDFPMRPIQPSGRIEKDITAVKHLLKGHTVLGVENTCLDPQLYGIRQVGAIPVSFSQNLNEMAPAVIMGDAEATLLDVADSLIALNKWPGELKVIGPISPLQEMGCGFRKSSPELRAAFNDYLEKIKKNGTYRTLIKKYYPAVFDFYPDFFENKPVEILP
jgi:ABC-type amino acid transport substrate-binding protein